MMRLTTRLLPIGVLALVSAACAGREPKLAPSGGAADFARAYEEAQRAEALDPAAAEGYLDLVDLAVTTPDAPGALPAVIAAVDALTSASLPALEGVGAHAVAFRSRELVGAVVERLRRAWYVAGDRSEPSPNLPFIRGAIAAGLHTMALFVGDVKAATAWSARRGCAATAAVIGPLDWTPLRSLEDPSPIDPRAPFAAGYPGLPPFAAVVAPIVVRADGCELDVNAATYLQGTRAVVIDVDVPRPQTVHLALTSSSAAVVDAGGVRVLRRGFEGGGRPLMRLTSFEVTQPGPLRVVARIAQKGDGNHVELDVWGDDGRPLAARAPRVGETATATVGAAREVEIGALPGPSGALLAAAALLGLGDARAAEHLIEPAGDEAGARSPGLDLLYARSLALADDLPENKAQERLRGALERTLAAWPDAWEARLSRAAVIERRRGAGDGPIEALRELGADPSRQQAVDAGKAGAISPAQNRLVAAYVAMLARRARLHDVMETAYASLAKQAPDAPITAEIERLVHRRSGPSEVRAACEGGLSRADTGCFEAHRARGDFGAALAELDRLRRLRGSERALSELELATRILAGDLRGALATYDAMLPGERRLGDALGFAAGGAPAEARARASRDRLSARDAPYALMSLHRALGISPDPAPHLEEEGRRLVLADQRAAFLPGAGTAVLRHVERYRIDEHGLVHFVFHDLRRVSGTTDVAQGGNAYGPAIEGRTALRLLRKRIHKRDGRVLEPDAAANAQQASDLSQLEQGDYVEHIGEGWALPGDTGQLVLNTPELLPERTSVREATIEIRSAASIPFAIWSHPLLGAPEDKTEGDTRIRVWRLSNQPPRRIEDGVPRMEQRVSVSLGTQTWAHIARALQENVRSLEDRDPFVVRWAEAAAGADRTPNKALVDRVVAAAGKKVKVGGGGELSDVAAMFGGGSQRQTARTTIELGQGSRSWLIYRALRAVGVKAELAIAESEPWSTVATYPANVGRFRHPLVIARLGDAGGDVWIDADVEGPPLPPGRISPELRGRTAMLENGSMVTVEAMGGETGDEIDVRLALDDKGDARGTFTALLHGRAAQALAEVFETVVGTERREVLRGVVLAWLPWADVEDVAISSSEGSWEIALRATIAIHGFGRPEGKDGKTWVLAGLEPVHQVFPKGPVGTLAGVYASRGARQNALSIDAPLQYHLRRRIELPAGATVTRAPADVHVVDQNVQARRKRKQSGQTIEEDFVLSLPTGTVPAGRYQAFVEKVQAIDDGFMIGTRIKVK